VTTARFPFVGSVFEVGPSERWVSLCGCGSFHAFFLSRPDWQPEDPLTAALGDPQRPKEATRPWLRLFQLSSGFPWRLPWRHVAVSCAVCTQEVTFGVWTIPRYDIRAHSMICLACGHTTVEHVYPGLGQSETPITGWEWTPPCVAVARLRRAVFTQSALWTPPPLRGSSGEEGDENE
jgi:hypothetical protein